MVDGLERSGCGAGKARELSEVVLKREALVAVERELLGPAIGGRRSEVEEAAAACVSDARAVAVPRVIREGEAWEAGGAFVAVVEGRGRQGFRTGRTRGLLGPVVGCRRPEIVGAAAACVSGDARAAAAPIAIMVGGLCSGCLREGVESKGME